MNDYKEAKFMLFDLWFFQVLDAKHVYLLMKKEYRISRNIRASWYFRHLHTLIKYTPTHEWVRIWGTCQKIVGVVHVITSTIVCIISLSLVTFSKW